MPKKLSAPTRRKYQRYSPELIATVVATHLHKAAPSTVLSRTFGPSDFIIRRWCRLFGDAVDTPHEVPFDELVAAIIKAVENRKQSNRNASAARRMQKASTPNQDLHDWLIEQGVDVELLESIPKKIPGADMFSAPDMDKLTSDPELLKKILRQQQLAYAVLAERQKLLEEGITRLGKDHAPTWGVKTTTRIALAVIARGFTVAETLQFLGLASSSFYYSRTRLDHCGLARRAELAAQVIEICEAECYRVGYRVVHAILKQEGTRVSEKIVRQIMAEFDLSPKIKRRRSYSFYRGEADPAVANRLHVADAQGRAAHEQVIELSTAYRNRVDADGMPVLSHDFHADAPNQKWVTDISEIPCQDGKLYLSPVIDLYDMYPVSVMVGNRPSVALVTEMIQDAIDQLQPGQTPIIHSDRGFHYRAKAWFETITTTGSAQPVENLEDYRIIPSMSRKATSGDNAAMEGFFGMLKREVFYYHDISPRELTGNQVIAMLDEYITWYIYRRRFKRLGYRTLAHSRGLESLPTHTAA